MRKIGLNRCAQCVGATNFKTEMLTEFPIEFISLVIGFLQVSRYNICAFFKHLNDNIGHGALNDHYNVFKTFPR